MGSSGPCGWGRRLGVRPVPRPQAVTGRRIAIRSPTMRAISRVPTMVVARPAPPAGDQVAGPVAVRRARRRRPPRSPPPRPPGPATSAAASPRTGSCPAGWPGPGPRCRARSRGSARTGRAGRARSRGVPIDADGSMPSEPLMTAASSDRMSPNRFSVTMTSNAAGDFASSIAAESTSRCSRADVRELRVDLLGHLAPQPRRREHVGLVHLGDLGPARPGELERQRDDAPDLRLGVPEGVDRGPPLGGHPLLGRAAEVEARGELADDQAVDALEELGPQRRRCRSAPGGP